MNNDYRTVSDLDAYVRELLRKGISIFSAEKTARIAARPGIDGETILSWTEAADGSPLLERTAVVSADPVTGTPDWVATKVDENAQAAVDRNGNLNRWIIPDRVFRSKYEPDPQLSGLFRPRGSAQRLLPLAEPLHILYRGAEWFVDAGGYLNVSDPDHYYVISQRDFQQTYRVIP